MKKAGDLLKELGFNKDAPLETQKAFFRHLVAHAERSKALNNYNLQEPVRKQETVTETSTQLSFDPEILGLITK